MKKIFLMPLAALLGFAISCSDDVGNPDEVLANSGDISSGQYHSATMTGTIYGSGITDRGLCWALAKNPTLENYSQSEGSGGAGTFTMTIDGLTAGTTYYVRPYATMSDGKTTYGSSREVATTKYLSTSITDSIPDLTSIVLKANVLNGLEDLVVTERGIWYGTSTDPETTGTKIKAAEGGKGNFTIEITGLNMETTYYFKSYAISSEGTIYSNLGKTKTLKPTPELFLNALKSAGLKYGVVRDASNEFVMHYTYDINTGDADKCYITITYIDPTGDKDAKHVKEKVTFNPDYSQASWTAVSNDGNDFSGMTRNGTNFGVTGTTGLTLDTPIPQNEILAIFTSTNYGGISRISELHSGNHHSSIPTSFFDNISVFEVKGSENGILANLKSVNAYVAMPNVFKDGKPNMPQSEDRITFAFGGYSDGWEKDSGKRQATFDYIEPVRNIWYDTDGLIIVRELKEGNPIFGSDASAGAFYYYAISAKNEKWVKLWLRQWGK